MSRQELQDIWHAVVDGVGPHYHGAAGGAQIRLGDVHEAPASPRGHSVAGWTGQSRPLDRLALLSAATALLHRVQVDGCRGGEPRQWRWRGQSRPPEGSCVATAKGESRPRVSRMVGQA